MSVSVIFYNNKSDENVINKNITYVSSLSFNNIYDINTKTPYLKGAINVLSSPTWKWQSGKQGINYAKVESTINKYYYVTSTEIIDGFLYIHLKCDVLMTYKPALLNSYQLISKSENNFNRYLNDPNYKSLNYNRVQFKKFPNGFTGDYKFVLLVGGGS